MHFFSTFFIPNANFSLQSLNYCNKFTEQGDLMQMNEMYVDI